MRCCFFWGEVGSSWTTVSAQRESRDNREWQKTLAGVLVLISFASRARETTSSTLFLSFFFFFPNFYIIYGEEMTMSFLI